MRKLYTFTLSAIIAMGLVSCGNNKLKTTFDYVKDKDEVIWDTGYLTVTFEDYNADDPLNTTVKLKAENKSDKSTSLFIDSLYVNDRNMTSVSSIATSKILQAGETKELEFGLIGDMAENSYIDEIGQISFYMLSRDPESLDLNNMYRYSDEIIIKTDKTDWKENQKIPDGELLYDKDGLQISALLDDKNFMAGYLLPLYIKNDGDNSSICLSKMRIDGKETDISDVNVVSVKKGKDAVKFITIYPAYEDISEYSKTEVQFTVTVNGEGNENTFNTDYITIQGLT